MICDSEFSLVLKPLNIKQQTRRRCGWFYHKMTESTSEFYDIMLNSLSRTQQKMKCSGYMCLLMQSLASFQIDGGYFCLTNFSPAYPSVCKDPDLKQIGQTFPPFVQTPKAADKTR